MLSFCKLSHQCLARHHSSGSKEKQIGAQRQYEWLEQHACREVEADAQGYGDGQRRQSLLSNCQQQQCHACPTSTQQPFQQVKAALQVAFLLVKQQDPVQTIDQSSDTNL